MSYKFNIRNGYATCKLEENSDFRRVIPNQAVTPAEMMDLAERGIPVSTANVENFIDGQPNPSFDLPATELRGMDINDAYAQQISSRRKFKSYSKARADALASQQKTE